MTWLLLGVTLAISLYFLLRRRTPSGWYRCLYCGYYYRIEDPTHKLQALEPSKHYSVGHGVCLHCKNKPIY